MNSNDYSLAQTRIGADIARDSYSQTSEQLPGSTMVLPNLKIYQLVSATYHKLSQSVNMNI
eukprot:scaffold451082_cov22-Prasinocladus_malaysianus.AAC.2